LHGLTVSQAEYDRHFRAHEDKISVYRKGALLEIWSKDGGGCPNWDEQCSVYETRPMDCDLYPFTIGNVFESPDEIYVTYHKRTGCPLVDDIVQARSEAQALLERFFKANFPSAKKVSVVYDEGPVRLKHFAKRALRKLRRRQPKLKLS
jgi:Fe-S-cluster containining protein